MALARSIRECVERNMQKLRIKKKNGSVRRREISADFGGEERRRGGGRSSSGGSSDSGAVVVLGCTRRSRSRSSCNDTVVSSISSSGTHCKNSSTSFVSAAPRAKRIVSPQGRKKAMGLMKKIAGSFRRAWDIVACRHIHQSRPSGMGRLYNDVRSCGYDDVHLMWSMLQTQNVKTPRWRRLSRFSLREEGVAGRVEGF